MIGYSQIVMHRNILDFDSYPQGFPQSYPQINITDNDF